MLRLHVRVLHLFVLMLNLLLFGVAPYPAFALSPLNDTGFVNCYEYDDDYNTKERPCPILDFPRQDGDLGRDVTNNNPTDGHAGFSFTKIGANGETLPASAKAWSCVRDNTTNLIWEVKTTDGGLRDMGWEYTWYNPDPYTNGGYAGARSTVFCGSDGCDTLAYVRDVNKEGLCGATDWRLPTMSELLSIVTYDRGNPSVDMDYFPNMQTALYWTSSPNAMNGQGAWVVIFDTGRTSIDYKMLSHPVLLVRDGK